MSWDALDFTVFGFMLVAAGAGLRFAFGRSGSTAYRLGAGFALAAAFLLVWVNGAVGIIGSENEDANMMYFGVLFIAMIGAGVSRFRARGLARTMAATAFAQVLVAVIALAFGFGETGPIWPRDILFLTVFFAALWLISARLFSNAARERWRDGPPLKG